MHRIWSYCAGLQANHGASFMCNMVWFLLVTVPQLYFCFLTCMQKYLLKRWRLSEMIKRSWNIPCCFHLLAIFKVGQRSQIKAAWNVYLTLSSLGKIFNRQHIEIFFFFLQKTGLTFLFKLSSVVIICMKFQNPLSGKNKKRKIPSICCLLN